MDKPFLIYEYRRAEFRDLGAIAQLGHDFFGSESFRRGLVGRELYITRLWERNNRVFWVLEYRNPAVLSAKRIVGYTSILPEVPDIAMLHRGGAFDQYTMQPQLIVGGDERNDALRPTFYVQAVAVTERHNRTHAAITERDHMIAHHVADLLKQTSTQDFRCLAESFSGAGRNFMEKHGFKPNDVESPTNHKIYLFRSEDPDLPRRGREMLAEVNALRAA
ncbi:MAG: hypothetical protein ABJB74_05675 [Gemmatimonas sp.]